MAPLERVAAKRRETTELECGIKLVRPRKVATPADGERYMDPSKYTNLSRGQVFNEMQEHIAEGFAMQDHHRNGAAMNFLWGGTELGKTTAVEDICATMGYKHYEMSLSSGADETVLVGGPRVNPNSGPADPRKFIVVLSEILEAMKEHPDQIAVVNISEFNSAPPGVLIKLHGIIDAYKRGQKEMTFPELGGLTLPLNLGNIRFVITGNPPAPGYFEKYKMDEAMKRRMQDANFPSELPLQDVEDHFENRFSGLAADPVNFPGFQRFIPAFVQLHIDLRRKMFEKQLGANLKEPAIFPNRSSADRVFEYITTPDLYTPKKPVDINDLKSKMRKALQRNYTRKMHYETDFEKQKRIAGRPVQPSDREYINGEIEKLVALIG